MDPMDPMDIEELKALTGTLDSFLSFHNWQYTQVVQPKVIKYRSLDPEHQKLLPFFPQVISNLEQCVSINDSFVQQLSMVAAQDWDVPAGPDQWAKASHSEFDKVRSTLLQLAREWSDDGKKERDITFGPILDEVEKRFPENRDSVKVLVPGCGLGRLVYEFVKRGFCTQGNEVSYHMLLALGYVLNRMPLPHSHTIFPYIYRLSHVVKRLYQQRPVSVPDESPTSIFSSDDEEHNAKMGELMLMAAGSFVELYGPGIGVDEVEDRGKDNEQERMEHEFRQQNKDCFDVVATCFFLDTAHNVIDYLKTIHHCLKPDGIWVNMGPLLWHYEGDSSSHIVKQRAEDGSIKDVPTVMEGLELTREELIELVEKCGFKIERHESDISTTYSSDTRALGNFVYDAEFWVARKL